MGEVHDMKRATRRATMGQLCATRMRRLARVGLVASFTGCALPPGYSAKAPASTIEAPTVPRAENPMDAALVDSIRGYLHTFKLSEKDVTAGLTIPFGFYADDPNLSDYCLGTARATGKLGPRGHEVYEVVVLRGYVNWSGFTQDQGSSRIAMEIAPEPDTALAATIPNPRATPPPAPTAR